jgi:hypothetical protein
MRNCQVPVIVLLFCMISISIQQRPFQRYFYPNANETQAVCNDGTPSVYYFRNSTVSNSTKWNIWLMGGFWCWDAETCDSRYHNNINMMSSKELPEMWQWGGGIFDDSKELNPDFYDANSVWAWYCSSDAWSGDTLDAGTGYQFRGKKILKSLVEVLATNHGLSDATEVVLSGCSAGSLGVLVNADYVRDLLKQNVKRHEKLVYKAIADSGLFFDMEVVSKDIVPQKQQFQMGVQLWQGIVNDNCRNTNTKQDWYKCYLGDYILPYIESPLLVRQDKYDAWQLMWALNNFTKLDPDHNPLHRTYANKLGSITDNVLRKYAVTTSYQNSVWLPSCIYHCMLTAAPAFTETRVNQISLSDQAGLFFPVQQQGLKDQFDNCEGFTCSQNCPVV